MLVLSRDLGQGEGKTERGDRAGPGLWKRRRPSQMEERTY